MVDVAQRPVVVVLDDYQGVAENAVDWAGSPRKLDVRCVREHVDDPAALRAVLADADIVVAMRERTPLPADLIDDLPRLRLIVTTGMANAVIDVAAASRRGIPVCGTASSSAPPAELTWALIHAATRHLVAEDARVRSGAWQGTIGRDLAGATLGIMGLGRIGSRVARVALAFEMEVLAWSRHLRPEIATGLGARAVSKEELLARSDIVSLHLRLSEESRHTLDRAALARMRPGAILVNTSRSGLVDMDAAAHALREGHLGALALDVYDREPVPVDDPVLALPRTVLTPHLGYVTEDNYRRFFADVLEDIDAFLAGAPVRVLTG